ncbi:CHASE4 domain-containing protein [Asticcacaulis sp. MM231]|uniref:CHASE4 domain-containing protein n=1 Tax=Asticcacaulis sp. MM231 TaxID=3157666 RepID=UPI0032D5AA9B
MLDEQYRILWGASRGKAYMRGGLERFGKDFKAQVEHNGALLRDGKGVVTGFSKTRSGPALVAITLIRRSDSGIANLGTVRRYLVMTRHLTPAKLSAMSETFGLAGLRLAPAAEQVAPAYALRGEAGKIGQLTWTERRPGKEAARAASGSIRQVAGVTALIILIFVLVSAFALYKMAKSEKLARTLALTDGLSGLPNRRALFELVQKSRIRRVFGL